jgi:hypothetical protein
MGVIDLLLHTMLFGLECLSKKVSDGHVNATSLRATIEEVYHTFSTSLKDIEIDDGEEYEGAVYCTLRFTHGLVDGSMILCYEDGDLGLASMTYDGSTCEPGITISVSEFIQTLGVLDENEWFKDANNSKALDDDGQKLLNRMRQLVL